MTFVRGNQFLLLVFRSHIEVELPRKHPIYQFTETLERLKITFMTNSKRIFVSRGQLSHLITSSDDAHYL